VVDVAAAVVEAAQQPQRLRPVAEAQAEPPLVERPRSDSFRTTSLVGPYPCRWV
jgi:hypothetical protein